VVNEEREMEKVGIIQRVYDPQCYLLITYLFFIEVWILFVIQKVKQIRYFIKGKFLSKMKKRLVMKDIDTFLDKTF
jgi:hypothetical protein